MGNGGNIYFWKNIHTGNIVNNAVTAIIVTVKNHHFG